MRQLTFYSLLLSLSLSLTHTHIASRTESTWTMPVYHGYTVAFVDEATGKRFWQHAKTGETTWYVFFLYMCVFVVLSARELVLRTRPK